ncbi:hypothetical protein FA13DRAFT_1792260 [Coprinellus micaceus]|uniref:Uncharacterized protein n=1 Tax=Coprinellus micaceus TaxID=71717 RepID=A0A4Y7T919_COPMI|nr:hypothetical protein FA13DRAFT_1792260 [Coprinellus micaceus]
MGRSAKLHKRVKKTTTSSSNPTTSSSQPQAAAAQAKKKATLKSKTSSNRGGKGEGPVLGGADYVSLMMGGRRKAREEAKKMPMDED